MPGYQRYVRPNFNRTVKLACLKAALNFMLADDRLTERELARLIRTRRALGLSSTEVRELRAEVYHRTHLSLEQGNGMTPAATTTLDRLMQFFNSSPE
ncbi:hypothetical protein Q0M94_08450 [Deinococcus radiomollis]|uniref:hypothetical protein n=1 Tax=Deinococcus radiomollis TaxID=468916 RepID=UPI003891FAA5